MYTASSRCLACNEEEEDDDDDEQRAHTASIPFKAYYVGPLSLAVCVGRGPMLGRAHGRPSKPRVKLSAPRPLNLPSLKQENLGTICCV